jgi:hypothetical protein
MGNINNLQIFHYYSKGIPSLMQGDASKWRVHSTLIFENLKPVEKSKNHNNII